MIDLLKKLIELQELDTQILALKKQVSAIPATLRKEQSKYEKAVRDLQSDQTAHRDLEERGRQILIDIESANEHVRQLRSRQGQIRKNNEYQALTIEIRHSEEDVQKHRLALEQQAQMLQDVDSRIAERKTAVEVQRSDLLAHAQAGKKEIGELHQKLERCRKIRQDMIKSINHDALTMYNRVLKTRAPNVLVPVVDGICTGCNIQLPVQVLSDIMKADRLVICETCARVLYLPDQLQQPRD
jgi:hypothetical protein